MSVVWNSRFQKHYSQRILQNEVRETPSIPVRRVRKDVLFDERHALLPSPTSKRDVSRGSWKKNGALHSVIRVSDQAATSACLRTSLRPW